MTYCLKIQRLVKIGDILEDIGIDQEFMDRNTTKLLHYCTENNTQNQQMGLYQIMNFCIAWNKIKRMEK